MLAGVLQFEDAAYTLLLLLHGPRPFKTPPWNPPLGGVSRWVEAGAIDRNRSYLSSWPYFVARSRVTFSSPMKMTTALKRIAGK